MRVVFLIVFEILFIMSASSQEIRLIRTPMMDRLYSMKTSISDISGFPFYYDPFNCIKEKRVIRPEKFVYKLLVNDSGLFLLTNGAGFVYKAIKTEKDSLVFRSVDSTVFAGYNGNAIRFSFKNKIYSLGGYGFWHTNGYLLRFEPGKDWQIKTLNNAVPAMLKIHSFDDMNGLLYFFASRTEDQSIGKIYNQQKFYVLDVENRKNTELGYLNQKYSSLLSTDILFNVPALEGVLVEENLNLFLVSIKKNRVFKLKNQQLVERLKFEVLNSPNVGYMYSKGSYLFYCSTYNSQVDSLKLSILDFESLNDPLYFSTSFIYSLNREEIIFSIIVFFLLGLVLYLLFIYKEKQQKVKYHLRKNIVVSNNNIDNDYESNSELSTFTDFERLIIKLMLEKNVPFTVNQMNEILGLKKKTPDFQKKVRTESINRINLKYQRQFSTNADLIIRVKSNDDKRFVLYSISTDYVKELNAICFN